MNAWIKHVKAYAKKHNVSYKVAMKKAKKTYQRGGDVQVANDTYKRLTKPLLSNDNGKMKVVEKDGKVIVGFRGTKLNDVDDLLDDALVVQGGIRKSDRYKKSRKEVKDLISKYGKDNVELSGHSLGGSIARELSRDLGVKADVYNPGSSFSDFTRGVGDRVACKFKKN